MNEYWVYENWRAHGHQAKLHNSTCPFCNNGKGLSGGTRKDNGRWIALGEFNNHLSASQHAKVMARGAKLEECRVCVKAD